MTDAGSGAAGPPASLAARVSLMTTAALLVLAFFPPAAAPFSVVKEDLFFAGTTVSIVLWGLARRLGGLPLVPRPGQAVILLPVALLAVLGVFQVIGGGAGREASPMLNLAFGAMVLLMLLSAGPGGVGERMASVLTLSSLAAGIYAAADSAFGPFVEWDMSFAGAASGGTFGNPLFLADCIVIFLPYAALRAMAASGGRKAAWSAVALVMVHSLLVSQGRGAWAAGTVAGAALVLVVRRTRPGLVARNRPWLALAVLAAAMDFALLSFPNPLNRGGTDLVAHVATLATPLSEGGLRGRLLMWEATARMAAEKPLLGRGPGRVRRDYTAFQAGLFGRPLYRALGYRMTQHSHQDYLQLLAERGVVGLGLFLWLLAIWFRGMAGLAARPPAEFAVRAGMLCGMAGWLADALVNSPFLLTPNQQLFWFALALGWRPGPAERAVRRLPSRGRTAALVVVGVLLALFLARPYVRDLASEGYSMEGRVSRLRGNHPQALEAASKALALSIEDRRHWFHIGDALLLGGDPAGAEEAYGKDIELNPFFASSWCNLGLARLMDGRPAESVKALERAAALAPFEPDIRVKLADALARAGNARAAVREWRAARGMGYRGAPPAAVARLMRRKAGRPLPDGRTG